MTILLMLACLMVGAVVGFFMAALMAMSAQQSRQTEREAREKGQWHG